MPDQSHSIPPVATAVTVRGLAPELKARLRIRAAHNSRSMEAEARAILEAALSTPGEDPTDLGTFARRLFGPLGGVDLELPPRKPAREPPGFVGGKQPAAGRPTASSAGAGRTSKGSHASGSRRRAR